MQYHLQIATIKKELLIHYVNRCAAAVNGLTNKNGDSFYLYEYATGTVILIFETYFI